jgi:hypothetical protein
MKIRFFEVKKRPRTVGGAKNANFIHCASLSLQLKVVICPLIVYFILTNGDAIWSSVPTRHSL